MERAKRRIAAWAMGFALLLLLAVAPSAQAQLGWYLKNSNTDGYSDVSFTYGDYWDTPVVGDWNGDGVDTPGSVRHGNLWLLRDSNSPGSPDRSYWYGNPTGMVPIAGDWNGDGWDTPGMYADGVFYLNDTHSGGYSNVDFRFAPAGVPHRPLVGDFNNDGKDTTGVFRDGRWWAQNVHSIYTQIYFEYGNPHYIPLMGDWDGDGVDTHGVYDWGNGTFYLRNTNTTGPTDVAVRYGDYGDIPIVGDWDGDGVDTVGVVRRLGSPPAANVPEPPFALDGSQFQPVKGPLWDAAANDPETRGHVGAIGGGESGGGSGVSAQSVDMTVGMKVLCTGDDCELPDVSAQSIGVDDMGGFSTADAGERRISAAAKACATVSVKRVGRSLVGAKAYVFRVNKSFCYKDGRVTSFDVYAYAEWTDGFHWYRGIKAKKDDYYDALYKPKSGHYSFRQGEFENCVPKYGCISVTYPWVKIWVRGNGTFRWQKG